MKLSLSISLLLAAGASARLAPRLRPVRMSACWQDNLCEPDDDGGACLLSEEGIETSANCVAEAECMVAEENFACICDRTQGCGKGGNECSCSSASADAEEDPAATPL